jgi:Tol biopolymer transport system component
VWSPDGQRIAFSADWVNGVSQIFLQAVDPAAPAELLFTGQYHIHLTDWSPDGKWIVFYYVTAERRQDIYAAQVDSAQSVVPLISTEAGEVDAQFSPDGEWFAYQSGGVVYLSPFPPTGGKHEVSTDRGGSPRWARQAGELFYWTGDTLMVTEVSTEGSLQISRPRPLFSLPGRTRYYDVTPDGQRFIVATRNPGSRALEIDVVRNWFQVLLDKFEG